jgi:signal peptidase I
MFDKWREYSYAAQKDHRHRLGWLFLWAFSFFLLYILLTSFLVSTRVLENETMQPGLHAGDRFVFSSFMIYNLLPDAVWFSRTAPFKRGNIVLVDTEPHESRSMVSKALDTGLRFFTAQRISLAGRKEHFFIKRVIGLPGDEISMTNFVLRVRPAGENYGLTEFELSDRPYDVTIPQVPALWDNSLPFSGNMETIVLADDECFVLSDDRSNTNDSRTWGPVSVDLVVGKALFRYWPVTRLGRP